MTAEPTTKQRHYVAAMIAKTAEPITYDEASRLIRDLKRDETRFPDLLEGIITADNGNDKERLGRLLASAKRRVSHGGLVENA